MLVLGGGFPDEFVGKWAYNPLFAGNIFFSKENVISRVKERDTGSVEIRYRLEKFSC